MWLFWKSAMARSRISRGCSFRLCPDAANAAIHSQTITRGAVIASCRATLLTRRRGRSRFGRIALVVPVGGHVGRNAEHANVGESHLFERLIRGPDVGAPVHRAAPAINDNLGVFRLSGNRLFQRFDSFGLIAR